MPDGLIALLPIVLSLLAVGVVAGLLAGLLGIGGGIVIVPILSAYVFPFLGIDPDTSHKLAVGTSLATIIPTSISSMRAHHKRGAVDFALLQSWGPAIAVGVLVGSALASYLRGDVLTAIFAVVALVVSLQLMFVPESLRLADSLPTGWRRAAIGGVIGTISSMMGIGGATLSVPTLVLSNFPVHRAVGTASAIGLIIAVPGTLSFIATGAYAHGLLTLGTGGQVPPGTLGFVSLLGFAAIVPATVLVAPQGAKIAHMLPRQQLRFAFAVFLAITSIRMFWRLIG